MSTVTPPPTLEWTFGRDRVAELGSATHVGRVREINEDALLATPRVLAVADGMGGALAGEVAARTTIDVVRALADVADPGAALPAAVTSANATVHALAGAAADLAGMGTTLTAVAFGDGELTVAHVGDSRLYRVRDGELARLTSDHTLAAAIAAEARGAGDDVLGGRFSNVLLRAVGPQPEVQPDVETHRFEPGDAYVLCSDGLTKHVTDEEIAAAAAADAPPVRIAGTLVDLALSRGGSDNVTVVVFRTP